MVAAAAGTTSGVVSLEVMSRSATGVGVGAAGSRRGGRLGAAPARCTGRRARPGLLLPEVPGTIEPIPDAAEAGLDGAVVVLLQGLQHAHLGTDVDLEPLAGDERELVLQQQIAGV